MDDSLLPTSRKIVLEMEFVIGQKLGLRYWELLQLFVSRSKLYTLRLSKRVIISILNNWLPYTMYDLHKSNRND